MSVDKWAAAVGITGIVLVALLLVALLAGANYRECRSSGFSARYCALTHLVR